MKDCPICQKPVDGFTCPHCGYAEPSAASAARPDTYYCAHTDRGIRCTCPGSLTSNIHPDIKTGQAHPGPWCCSKHYPPFTHWPTQRAALPAGGFNAIRRQARMIGQTAEDIAERLAIRSEEP